MLDPEEGWYFSSRDFFPAFCAIFSPSGLGVLLSGTQTGPMRGPISPRGTKVQTAPLLLHEPSPTGAPQVRGGCPRRGTTRGWGATRRPVQATELRKRASSICLETASKRNKRAAIEQSVSSKLPRETSPLRWKRHTSTAAP